MDSWLSRVLKTAAANSGAFTVPGCLRAGLLMRLTGNCQGLFSLLVCSFSMIGLGSGLHFIHIPANSMSSCNWQTFTTSSEGLLPTMSFIILPPPKSFFFFVQHSDKL